MSVDCSVKRATFIGKVNSLYQEFYFSTPDIKSRLVSSYCCAFYGSCLWNLYKRDTDKLYKSYNVATRIGHSLPRTTHRYFIEELTEFHHPKILLASRFVKFHDSLINSKKPALRLLSKICREDASTVFGSNLRKIAAECGVQKDELKQYHVKEKMSYFVCPNTELWRIPLIHNLIEIRSNEMFLENFDRKDIESIIEDVCTN